MRSRRIREPVSGRACKMGMPVSADADGMVPTSTAARTMASAVAAQARNEPLQRIVQ